MGSGPSSADNLEGVCDVDLEALAVELLPEVRTRLNVTGARRPAPGIMENPTWIRAEADDGLETRRLPDDGVNDVEPNRLACMLRICETPH